MIHVERIRISFKIDYFIIMVLKFWRIERWLGKNSYEKKFAENGRFRQEKNRQIFEFALKVLTKFFSIFVILF